METFIICVDIVKSYLTLFSILIKIYDLFSWKFYVLIYFWLFSPDLFIFFWRKCSILALCFLIQNVLCMFYLLNLKSTSNFFFSEDFRNRVRWSLAKRTRASEGKLKVVIWKYWTKISAWTSK